MNQHLHIMGIAGSGAKAFAEIAKARGYRVSGCDRSLEGHSPKHLDGASPAGPPWADNGGVDVLIISPAILSLDPGNPELIEAKRRGIGIFTWQEFLGEYLMEGRKVVGVCGSHGKSTIAAMLSYVLEGAGFDPSFLIGAKILGGENFRVSSSSQPLGSTGLGGNKPQGLGRRDLFVVEADEFNDNFLSYPVFMSVCVSLEFDHPEYFSDFDHYLSSFVEFVRKGQALVCNKADRGVASLLSRLGDWGGEAIAFDKPYRGSLVVPGEHNLINAQAAYLAARSLGVAEGRIQSLLASFPGTERRLELKKIVSGTKIYSDYAHHPTQLEVVCSTIRQLYPRDKITVVFQPHMFSRTKALFGEFVSVLRKISADCIIVTDIFPSREKDPGDIKARDLVDAAGVSRVMYLPKDEIIQYLKRNPTDAVVFAGAGDIDGLIEKL